jgi:transcriptional regulator GlxA family with amidase domain
VTSPSPSKTAAILLQPGTSVFEVAAACEVLGTSRPELAVPWYDFVVSTSADDRVTHRPWAMSTDRVHGPDRLAGAGRSSLPHGGAGSAPRTPVVEALHRTHGRGARVAGLRSGVLVLRHAGLLDGRRAATHWRHVDALNARFPGTEVDPDVRYVDEDPVFVSAGTDDGLDPCRSPVRLDRGLGVAEEVASRPRRSPSSRRVAAQVVTPPTAGGPDPPALMLDRAVAPLERPRSVEDRARQGPHERSAFARRFVDTVRATPLQSLLRQRLLHARSLLESTDEAVEGTARQAGFTSPHAMRTHFRRRTGMTPTRYRRPFRGQE